MLVEKMFRSIRSPFYTDADYDALRQAVPGLLKVSRC